jgi:hypothetical protein
MADHRRGHRLEDVPADFDGTWDVEFFVHASLLENEKF